MCYIIEEVYASSFVASTVINCFAIRAFSLRAAGDIDVPRLVHDHCDRERYAMSS